MEDSIRTLSRWIEESRNVVFFGGAGVSTESGVPDFRSKDGLYNQHDVRFDRYTPEYLLSHSCLVDEPTVFFEFYRQKMDACKAKPNAAHRYLAELERRGKLSAVVTQNIDGLHQDAGSRRVFEIHGSTRRNYCMRCGKPFPADYLYDCAQPVPRCECGGTVRCDVTLYEEALPDDAVHGAVRAIRGADMLIIGGTSLTVYPAASYVSYFGGKHLVIVNKQPLSYPLRPGQDLFICAPIGEVFGQLSQEK